ncbi:uncharacterized protein LOC129908272 [Episyrphus balteatus]|uniref:uncharacterized protein LOC129908272 n=1 Tax=Episyrphus balteatus TaxID=286459 RepID=UPI002484F74F|nr:uncharacterized protein LOC129908272 [Episyrphus balteatus]
MVATPTETELLDKDTQINTLNALLPVLGEFASTVMAFSPPAGTILTTAIGIIHVASMLMYNDPEEGKDNSAISNVNFMQCHEKLMEQVQKSEENIIQKTADYIDSAVVELKSDAMMTEMLNSLTYIRKKSNDNREEVLDNSIVGDQKDSIMKEMRDPNSVYRDHLHFFIPTFIKRNISLAVHTNTEMFDYILQKNTLLAKKNEDSHTDSLHSKIFKTYLVIAKILSDGYVLPIAAQAIQYQQEIAAQKYQVAKSTKKSTLKLMKQYENDMKALIDETKECLEKASREIRNTGNFLIENKKTTEALSFAKVLFKFFSIGQNGCNEKEGPLKFSDYEVVDNCKPYSDYVEPNSQLTLASDSNDSEKPYKYINYIAPNGFEGVLGHKVDGELVEEPLSSDGNCPTLFCNGYKKNAVSVCLQRLRAEPGNVITGYRFTVSDDGVLCYDIQEAKFIDTLTVDASTVKWTSPQPGGRTVPLTAKINKIQTGDFSVDKGQFVTEIQIKQGNRYDRTSDTLYVCVGGSNERGNWNSFTDCDISPIPASNEIQLDGDDPAQGPSNNLIKLPPVPGQRSFIKLQPSNFKKDLGQTSCPLIDIRPVVSNPPSPMSGFGLYIEAAEGSCGILAAKLISPDLSDMADINQIKLATDATKSA